MNRTDQFLFRFALTVMVICLWVMACIAIVVYVVGERAPSPSPGVPHASRADSEAAPARPLVDGNGEDGGPFEEGEITPRALATLRTAPASTVTTQALVASPSATAVCAKNAHTESCLVIDPVPATPVTTSPAVVTQGAESDIWALIAASPWPQYLWGTVACLVERESRGVATAVGLAGERGLMQISGVHVGWIAAELGYSFDDMFDPSKNLASAFALYQKVGLSAWTTREGC